MVPKYKLGFVVVFFLTRCLFVNTAECATGGTMITFWHYETDSVRISTTWSFNGNPMMFKDSADALSFTPAYDGRIAEYNGTHAGMILKNINTNETGMYSVDVDFNGLDDHSESLFLDLVADDIDIAINETVENAAIWINGTLADDMLPNFELPYTPFTFNLTGACIKPATISIYLDTQLRKSCTAGDWSCSTNFYFNDTGSINIEILTGDHTIHYECNNCTLTEPPPDKDPSVSSLSCVQRTSCIVPATVVPILVILTLSGLGIYFGIKKPCSE